MPFLNWWHKLSLNGLFLSQLSILAHGSAKRPLVSFPGGRRPLSSSLDFSSASKLRQYPIVIAALVMQHIVHKSEES